MATGIGRVVRQLSGIGTFAIVSVEVESHDAGLTLEFDNTVMSDFSAAPYRSAVEVGVRYAWEKLNRYARPAGVLVRVTQVQVMVVDTTEISVVYAAALAL